MKARRTAAIIGLVALFLVPFIIRADRPGYTRVEVIAPSRPAADAYENITVVAVRETGEIDRSFTADVYLWTDNQYIRPYHVELKPEDHGMTWAPARLEIAFLTRIEAYNPSGEFQAWSNPILPRADASQREYSFLGALPVNDMMSGPPLFWGRIGECEEPGLDFCFSETVDGSTDGPEMLRIIRWEIEDEQWILIPDPGLSGSTLETIADEAGSAKTAQALHEVISRRGGELATIRVAPELDQKQEKVWNQIDAMIGSAPAPSVLALARQSFLVSNPDAMRSLLDNAVVYAVRGRVPSVVPGLDAGFGVWAADRSPGGVWRALKAGFVYGCFHGRILALYPPLLDGSGKLEIMVAGYGPREDVRLYKWNGPDKGIIEFKRERSDDFRARISFDDEPGAVYFLSVTEPGPRGRIAVAGPLVRASR